MRLWNSYREAEQAVETIKNIYQEHQELPEPLTRSYNEILQRASKGIVARFYEKLTRECPEAMKYFV